MEIEQLKPVNSRVETMQPSPILVLLPSRLYPLSPPPTPLDAQTAFLIHVTKLNKSRKEILRPKQKVAAGSDQANMDTAIVSGSQQLITPSQHTPCVVNLLSLNDQVVRPDHSQKNSPQDSAITYLAGFSGALVPYLEIFDGETKPGSLGPRSPPYCWSKKLLVGSQNRNPSSSPPIQNIAMIQSIEFRPFQPRGRISFNPIEYDESGLLGRDFFLDALHSTCSASQSPPNTLRQLSDSIPALNLEVNVEAVKRSQSMMPIARQLGISIQQAKAKAQCGHDLVPNVDAFLLYLNSMEEDTTYGIRWYFNRIAWKMLATPAIFLANEVYNHVV